MKFEEVLPAFREGKRIKRRGWTEFCNGGTGNLSLTNIIADDWEIEPEPMKAETVIWVRRGLAERNSNYLTHRLGISEFNLTKNDDCDTKVRITLEEIR